MISVRPTGRIHKLNVGLILGTAEPRLIALSPPWLRKGQWKQYMNYLYLMLSEYKEKNPFSLLNLFCRFFSVTLKIISDYVNSVGCFLIHFYAVIWFAHLNRHTVKMFVINYFSRKKELQEEQCSYNTHWSVLHAFIFPLILWPSVKVKCHQNDAYL